MFAFVFACFTLFHLFVADCFASKLLPFLFFAIGFVLLWHFCMFLASLLRGAFSVCNASFLHFFQRGLLSSIKLDCQSPCHWPWPLLAATGCYALRWLTNFKLETQIHSHDDAGCCKFRPPVLENQLAILEPLHPGIQDIHRKDRRIANQRQKAKADKARLKARGSHRVPNGKASIAQPKSRLEQNHDLSTARCGKCRSGRPQLTQLGRLKRLTSQ